MQKIFQGEGDSESASLNRSNLAVETNQHQHWGEAIDVSIFYGRQAELVLLHQWIESDPNGISGAVRCRLTKLVGMGGIGKTALSAKLAEQLQTSLTI